MLLVGDDAPSQESNDIEQNPAVQGMHPCQATSDKFEIVLGDVVAAEGQDHIVDLEREQRRVEVIQYLLHAAADHIGVVMLSNKVLPTVIVLHDALLQHLELLDIARLPHQPL